MEKEEKHQRSSEGKAAVDMKYSELKIPEDKSSNVLELSGLIPTVSATPTFSPRRFPEQLRIMTGLWCFYDTTAAAWTCVGADTAYGGQVLAAATAGTPFPSGWSVANTGTGFCVVTHNLGHTNYVVLATILTNPGRANVQSVGTTSFAVRTQNAANADADMDFYFLVKDES